MELTLTGASLVSNNAGDGGVSSSSAASATTSTTTRRSIMNGEHAKKTANNANQGVRSAIMPLPSSTDGANGAAANGDHGHGHSHTNGHPESRQHGNGHDHSHSHDHGHCQHQHQHQHRLLVGGGAGAGVARMPMPMPPRPDVNTKEGRAEALLSAVKFGSFEQFRRAVDLVPETSRSDELDGYLPDGHTLAHWATKRCPDVRFLRLLADLPGAGVDLHRQSRDEVGMYPIHWAATEEDSIGVASFLLARIGDSDADADAADDTKPSTYNGMMTVAGVGMGGSMTEGMPVPPSTLFDGGTEGTPRRKPQQRSSLLPRPGPLHARDKSGCTPLLVAAQYGRANLAAFLIKRGADPSALDHSRDSALHWAAYKGNVAVAGLLLHLAGDSGGGGDHEGNSLPLDAPDKYGQTPLHLAALRGNSDVLEYFLEEAEHAYASSASNSALLRQPPPSPVRRSNHGGRFRGGGGGLRRLFGGRSATAFEAMEDNDLDLRLTTTPASSSQSLQSTSSSSAGTKTAPSPGSLLQMTDDEGRTPLDLSSKYNRKGCELVLREWIDRYHVHERAGGRNLGDRVVRCAVHLRGGARQLFSVDSWRAWMGLGLGGGSRQGEGDADLGHLQRQVKWPLVLVLLCMTVSAAMYPLRFVRGDMVLTGGKSAFWHMFTLTSMAAMWVTFVLTWRTNPGCIQTLDKAAGSRISTAGSRRRKLSGSGVGGGSGGDDIDVELHRIATELRSQYDEALERYAEDRSAGESSDADGSSPPATSAEPVPPLCHTCRIVRPLRSKHCRVQRRCVLVFDHYCPFVGNTVGLYNYRYFYGFLVSLVTSEIGFITTWVKYLAAAPGWDLFALSAGLLCGVFVVPGIGMAWYHTILVGRNLTTNEHQNMWRYRYLRDGRTGAYRNPFDAGILNNAHGRMFPDEKQYTLPPSSAAGGGSTAAGAEGTIDTLSGGGSSTANGVTGVQGDEEREELLSRMV